MNLQGRDVTTLRTLKKWATHRYKLQQNRVVFLISFVNLETDWLKTFDKRRIDG